MRSISAGKCRSSSPFPIYNLYIFLGQLGKNLHARQKWQPDNEFVRPWIVFGWKNVPYLELWQGSWFENILQGCWEVFYSNMVLMFSQWAEWKRHHNQTTIIHVLNVVRAKGLFDDVAWKYLLLATSLQRCSLENIAAMLIFFSLSC